MFTADSRSAHSTMSHLFLHPRCDELITTRQKIAAVVATIFTLGIPLMIDWMIGFIRDRHALYQSKKVFTNAKTGLTNQTELDALNKAEAMLRKTWFLRSKLFLMQGNVPYYEQPSNRTIVLLNAIFSQKRAQFKQDLFEIEQKGENPWGNTTTIEKSDEFFSLAYSIEHLMLQEFDLLDEGKKQATLFTSGNSYHFSAAAYLPHCYRMTHHQWKVEESEAPGNPLVFAHRTTLLGNPQFPTEWKTLHHAICDRFALKFSGEAMNAADSRLKNLTGKRGVNLPPPFWF